MGRSRIERFAPLTGAASVILFFAAAALYGVFEYRPPAEFLQGAFNAHTANLYNSSYLGALSAAFMIWFSGSLYTILRKHEGGEGRLSVVALGGGLLFSAGTLLASTSVANVAALANTPGGIDAGDAVMLSLTYGNMMLGPGGFSLAALLAASSVIALRSSMWPKWIGWLGMALSLGLVSPFGYAVMALAMLWLFAVSIWAFRKSDG